MNKKELEKYELAIYRQIVQQTDKIISKLLNDLKNKDKEIEKLKGENKNVQ